MTEAEWLVGTDPRTLLKRARFRSFRRKSRLFAVACCRCVWRLLVDDRSRAAVEVAELHADGAATDEELRASWEAADEAHEEMFRMVGKAGSCLEWAAAYAADFNAFHAAMNVTWMAATPRSYVVWSPHPVAPSQPTARPRLSRAGCHPSTEVTSTPSRPGGALPPYAGRLKVKTAWSSLLLPLKNLSGWRARRAESPCVNMMTLLVLPCDWRDPVSENGYLFPARTVSLSEEG